MARFQKTIAAKIARRSSRPSARSSDRIETGHITATSAKSSLLARTASPTARASTAPTAWKSRYWLCPKRDLVRRAAAARQEPRERRDRGDVLGDVGQRGIARREQRERRRDRDSPENDRPDARGRDGARALRARSHRSRRTRSRRRRRRARSSRRCRSRRCGRRRTTAGSSCRRPCGSAPYRP